MTIRELYREELKRKLTALLFWTLLFSFVYASFKFSKVDFAGLVSGFSASYQIIKEMLPPDFSGFWGYLLLSLETVAIGVFGTALGLILSFPISLLASRNLNSTPTYYLARFLVNFFRSIPEVLYALLFVLSMGIGPNAGAFALMFSTVGILSKFFSEAIESVDKEQVKAIRSTGSGFLGVVRYGVLPQVLPLFWGYTLYILDHNIRVAMVLGVVGAGGLGVELMSQMRSFNYQKVATILILIFAIISLIDWICTRLSDRVIKGSFGKGLGGLVDYALVSGLFVVAPLAAVFLTPISPAEAIMGFLKVGDLIKPMLEPNFSGIKKDLLLVLETIAIAFAGTFIAVVISIPLGFLSARNVVRFAPISRFFRELSNFLRAMPELIFAIILMAAVGPGPFAGVLAIGLHTAGLLGKFYAEAIENVNQGVVNAVKATGSDSLNVLRYGFFPQILPLFNSYNLYLIDRNVRAATIMGVVGAGGIGFELVMSIKLLDMERTAALIVYILIAIAVVDYVSSYIRKKIV